MEKIYYKIYYRCLGGDQRRSRGEKEEKNSRRRRLVRILFTNDKSVEIYALRDYLRPARLYVRRRIRHAVFFFIFLSNHTNHKRTRTGTRARRRRRTRDEFLRIFLSYTLFKFRPIFARVSRLAGARRFASQTILYSHGFFYFFIFLFPSSKYQSQELLLLCIKYYSNSFDTTTRRRRRPQRVVVVSYVRAL